MGFCQSRSNLSLFYFLRDTSIIYLLLCVHDIIVTDNDGDLLKNFIARTHKEFAIKDLGCLNYFIGLEVSCTSDGLFVGQVKYAHDILERVNLLGSKPLATPLATGETLVGEGSLFHYPTLYRSLVGALHYLTITRPHLSYVINVVNQFLHSPTNDHFNVVKRILCYVKATFYFGLSFTKRPESFVVDYSDTNLSRCIGTRRSAYGYSIFLGGNLISWSAKK